MTQLSAKQMGNFLLISVRTKVIPKDQLADHCLVMYKALLGVDFTTILQKDHPETRSFFYITLKVHSNS